MIKEGKSLEKKLQNLEERLSDLKNTEKRLETELEKETMRIYEKINSDLQPRINKCQSAFLRVSNKLKIDFDNQLLDLNKMDALNRALEEIRSQIHQRHYKRAEELIIDANTTLKHLAEIADASTCLSNKIIEALKFGIDVLDVSSCKTFESLIQDFCSAANSSIGFADVTLSAQGNTIYLLPRDSQAITRKKHVRRKGVTDKELQLYNEYYLSILSTLYRHAQEGCTDFEVSISSLPTPCQNSKVLRNFESFINRSRQFKGKVGFQIRKKKVSLSFNGISFKEFIEEARTQIKSTTAF